MQSVKRFGHFKLKKKNSSFLAIQDKTKLKAMCFKIAEEIFTHAILVVHFNSVHLGLGKFSPWLGLNFRSLRF